MQKGQTMPNFISNALTVTKGDPQLVWDAISGKDVSESLIPGRHLYKDSVFDPHRIIPVSGEYPDAHIEAWGTKWVDEAAIHPNHPNMLIFQTAWTAPYKVIQKIIAIFPDHDFDFGCSDDFAGECYEWTGSNGKMSTCKVFNYDLRSDDYHI